MAVRRRQPVDETVAGSGASLHAHLHAAVGTVLHPARDPRRVRGADRPVAVADALHPARNAKPQTARRRGLPARMERERSDGLGVGQSSLVDRPVELGFGTFDDLEEFSRVELRTDVGQPLRRKELDRLGRIRNHRMHDAQSYPDLRVVAGLLGQLTHARFERRLPGIELPAGNSRKLRLCG